MEEIKIAARRKVDRERQQRHRDRKKQEKQALQMVEFNGSDNLNEKAAKEAISAEWSISRSHLIDTVYLWGKRAAERLKLAQTLFFWSNGPVATVASNTAQVPQPLTKLDGDNILDGEITYRSELFALYQFVEAWRPDAIATFEEYLAERRSVKVDGTINLGNKYFRKNFAEQPHARWEDMLVKWNPDGLKPDYDQEDAKAWLRRQSEFKKRLLIACRSSYKSTFTLVSLIPAILSLPDIRLLLISETKPLSRDFIQGFRSFWTVKNSHEPSRFNRLFPECCVAPDTGSSLEFNSPMAHLDLFQSTAESSSMDSVVAGRRADVIVFDDPISNVTVATEDQRNKSAEKYDAILELLEVGGYAQTNSTPWHISDLSATILERNEKSTDKSLLYIIDPAWTTNESGKGKNLFDLEEQDVTLLFPSRLTWKVLQAKLRDGDAKGRKFRMQSLCMFLDEVEDDEKLQFDRAELQRHVIETAPADDSNVYASGDLGFSKSRYADPSVFTVFKIVDSKLIVLTQEAGNWRDSEKAAKIVDLQRRYPQILRWVIEKYNSFERLHEDVKMEGLKFNITVPLYWVPVTNRGDDKFHRIKSIETYLHQGRIKFVKGDYIQDLFNQLEKLDGSGPKRKSSTIHDDRADSLSIGIALYMPDPDDENAAARQEFEKEELRKRLLGQQYAAIFGDGRPITRPQPPEPETDNRGWMGIPGLGGTAFSGRELLDPKKKQISFGDLYRKT